MSSRLVKRMCLGFSLALVAAILVNCEKSKKTSGENPAQDSGTNSGPTENSLKTLQGTQDEVLDQLKKAAEEGAKTSGNTSSGSNSAATSGSPSRRVVLSRSSQFIWNPPRSTFRKPGDGYQRDVKTIIPAAYPPKGFVFAGGQSAIGSAILSPRDLSFDQMPFPFINMNLSDCVPPSPGELQRAKSYFEKLRNPWSSGVVHFHGTQFVTEQKAIVGTDFNTSGGKKSDFFVNNINPNGGFLVFLRAESNESKLTRNEIFEFILGKSFSKAAEASLLHVSLHAVSWGLSSPLAESLVQNSKCTQFALEDCAAELTAVLQALSESIKEQPLPSLVGGKINLGNWTEGCPALAKVSNLALF